MGAYMYPIQVKESQQEIRYTRNVTIYGSMSLSVLNEILKPNEYFFVFIQDGGMMADAYLLEIHGKRMETKKEAKDRWTKEKKYMEAYNKFHESKK